MADQSLQAFQLGASLFDRAQTQARMMEQFKLPASINYISLRETFISDAPFVKRTNASFWRKFLDSENFRAILSSNYHHIVGCIAESGMFDLESLYRFEGNQAVKLMSESYTEMYFNFSIKERGP